MMTSRKPSHSGLFDWLQSGFQAAMYGMPAAIFKKKTLKDVLVAAFPDYDRYQMQGVIFSPKVIFSGMINDCREPCCEAVSMNATVD